MTPSFKTESASEPSPAEPKTPAATAGQLLREARQKAGIHLAVLSVTLKVPVRQLEALEADELDPDKGPVFYRGLASSICRHLQTDPGSILALLPQPSGQLQPLRIKNQPFESEASLGIGSLGLERMFTSGVFWGAALMVLLTVAFLWLPAPSHWPWLNDVKSLMAHEVLSQEVNEPVATTPAPVLVTPAPLVNAPATNELAPALAAASSTPVQAIAAAKPVSSDLAAPFGPGPEWVFSASGESWLEVRNAQKAIVWSGLLKAGESIRIQSPLPVSVVVGRAQVVTVTLRGQPFDLKPHTQVTVARFEVKE